MCSKYAFTIIVSLLDVNLRDTFYEKLIHQQDRFNLKN